MEKPKISVDKIEQSIDLSDFVDVDLSNARGLKEQMGQALIDVIKERTDSGLSINGGKLKSPYSKWYQNTLEFKAAGKSATKVNMTLTGDMLASVDVEARSGSTLKLFVGEDQCPKAYNHLVGDTVPRRNWFGVTSKEVQDVVDTFKDDLDQLRLEDNPDSANGDILNTIDIVGARFAPFADDSED